MFADGDTLPVDVKEVEAESVAYILVSLLGLPDKKKAVATFSIGYTMGRYPKNKVTHFWRC